MSEHNENSKPPKTIDERLDALTQSVELIAAMQQTVEREQLKTGRQIRSLARLIRIIVIDHEARLAELEGEGDEDGEAKK